MCYANSLLCDIMNTRLEKSVFSSVTKNPIGGKIVKKYNVKDFTLEEKVTLLAGKDCWSTHTLGGKIPSLHMYDGPHGLRKEEDGKTVKTTAMPNLVVVANTWNPEMAYLDSSTIADDCVDNDADILLAPGVNIKRTPLCGRNFEYFSEDPFLAGELAKGYIQGLQDKGVGACIKHFCANNREYDRSFQTSEVDERTLREIYYPAFEKGLEAEPWMVMCSYNPVNGVYASENKKLLKDTLRGEFGFNGLIVSDWGAVHSTWRAVHASLDLLMPGWDAKPQDILDAVKDGRLSEEEVDFCAQNVLDLIAKKEEADKTKKAGYTKQQRHENAVAVAKEGIVLLKNEENLLPLKKGKILTVGSWANKPPMGGNGSARAQTEFEQKPLRDLMQEKLGDAATVEQSCSDFLNWNDNGAWRLKDSYQKAYRSDAVVLCVGPHIEGEGGDRNHIRLSQTMEEIIRNTAKYNENVIVCVHAGSAVDMEEWIDYVKAVVYVGFAGEGGNEALASVLTGETNPSGKLAESFPVCLEDTYCEENRGNGFVEWYDDGIFVGYRYYDAYGYDVQFPFGHGLSYAEFEYSNLKIEKKGDTDYEVSYDVTNVSDVDGKEVSQVYVKDVFCMVTRPEKELKGFSKDFIKAGETKRVCVKLDRRAFAYYNVAMDDWHVENGDFEIYVGASSRDLRLKGEIVVELDDVTQQSQM